MAKLSQLAGKLNPKLQPSSMNQTAASNTDNQVDLDQLFNFLGEDVQTDSVRSDSVRSSGHSTTSESGGHREASILDEIDRQMSDLQNEIDRCYKGTDREDSVTPPPPPPPPMADVCREMSPPPLPPPLGTTPPATSFMAKPSLPEPEGPPPPPPVQNGYAFSSLNLDAMPQQTQQQPQQQPKEPIYESIKPRPEPLGGPATPTEEYGFGQKANQNSGRALPKTPLTPAAPPPNPEREARRLVRVKRELERIQVRKSQA